jgi:phenylalanyl-tRNA synthetase beta chain
MKITYDWLKDHLETKLNEKQLIERLTDIGLEVENVETPSAELDDFLVARIIKIEKHPDADRLKVCDVDIGNGKILKVVCGASNARVGLLTIYAPPGSVIPKNKMKLVITKIRGVTSHGMLCSESELNISEESDGIAELESPKFDKKIGKKFFSKKQSNLIDLSITPNRPDCLGIRGIARDLAAARFGKFLSLKEKKINSKIKQKMSVKIATEKDQGCTVFGSCLVTGIKNCESPKWLKDKLISVGQKPISAVVDITNYVMLDLNRPMHAYDMDKINNRIIVRNSKNGEKFMALDKKEYSLKDGMCVISDNSGVLGLGGIIGGMRSSTEFQTKNVLIESAYFNPKSVRKTSKNLNIDTDAKFRFERGIDPLSIEQGLNKTVALIKEICGGEISKIDIQKSIQFKKKKIQFDIKLFEKISGFKISNKEIIAILKDLGFEVKLDKSNLKLTVPSWRPDISQEIDVVEELVRIYGYDKISTIEPIKIRVKPTLSKSQRLFHFLQRSVASKGYIEAVTWSFSDSKINNLFINNKKLVEIVNPISSDLDVLRNSIYSNLTMYLGKNLDRGFKDIALFEIGPVFYGSEPGDQETVIGGLRAGKVSRSSWLDKSRSVDVYDSKQVVIQTLEEAGFDPSKLFIDNETPSYYHPGKSGRVFLNKEKEHVVAFFGELHPNIFKKLDLKVETLVGFEIFLDNLKITKKTLKDQKSKYEVSDFQKSERDFAFIIDKNFKAQELVETIYSVDKELIKEVKIFDVYQGDNIPDNKKSVAINVTIQSMEKTLKDKDLDQINSSIIKLVETKTGAKIRS